MKKPETSERLLYLIGFVQGALDHAEAECGPQPQFGAGFEARNAWWHKREEAFEHARNRIIEEGGSFMYSPPDGHAIRLAGIRSSSTGGWHAVFNNWIRAAEKRVAEQAGKKHDLA